MEINAHSRKVRGRFLLALHLCILSAGVPVGAADDEIQIDVTGEWVLAVPTANLGLLERALKWRVSFRPDDSTGQRPATDDSGLFHLYTEGVFRTFGAMPDELRGKTFRLTGTVRTVAGANGHYLEGSIKTERVDGRPSSEPSPGVARDSNKGI